ncbi:MAG: electron transfer flavoprotein subunit beta/FixA family protein [Brevibacterium sp.]|uniref:electron transfer flavoprotein subunit beta/FixA family protein n=1 Tax=Brevibacterium sp. TaxID=1701 RepID=UPI00264849E3|nr:electron transfer flavoprotein subunit beta/FixA family protein [Brevibacterium sp.]MDN5807480.1 electron transfer flavoprotein subunit beta/FixA family protein [Brevibacterium sp.]MDN5833906.1 electron transfer flavoprotein subunit beta/FixA family protein [Brevibacterium sp.]MDN5876532.1 electron transfer flavoprotein subunit beta/FixA family protein [Brevibacterium sp.]MDN5909623.1 electron transfer flavoprotein subunit beta/FixA family protein [Brevibacterium sp.]MDN6133978.1 electron t
MKIAVLVKEVPDTYGDRKLNLETGLADRSASEAVLDEIGERALEVALSYKDGSDGTEVSVISMAPDTATATIRKGLAMGADNAVHVSDEELLGADLGLTAEVLAAAIRRGGFDLVITGNVSTDGNGGMMPAMLAEHLDFPHVTGLSAVEISDDKVAGTRGVESGKQEVNAQLPAVISITEALPEARFPNFKGIMAAKKKPFEVITLSDLEVDANDQSTARSIMVTVAEKPPREAGEKIVDEGNGGAELAEFLIKNRLA